MVLLESSTVKKTIMEPTIIKHLLCFRFWAKVLNTFNPPDFPMSQVLLTALS